MKKPRKNLTDKQECFAFEYIKNGRNASAAYRKCYDANAIARVVWVKAHEVLHNGNVAVRVKELQLQAFSDSVMDLEERLLLLSSLAREGDLKAVDMLNKMQGSYKEHNKQLSGFSLKDIIQAL